MKFLLVLFFCMQNPIAEFLVSDYAPTPAGVPKMGWHWVDLLSQNLMEEFSHELSSMVTMLVNPYFLSRW